MANDDDFLPRLGRQKWQRGAGQRRYLGKVLAAANLARGGAGTTQRKTGFVGSRIGRGAGIGRMLASHAGMSYPHRRRVIVKASIVKLAGKGAGRAAAHLRYLQRDGTTRGGEQGALYGREVDVVDGKTFLGKGAGDRHQFRFIVSAEDGERYEDLKPLTRRLMARIEEDLGTSLEWVAVDHFNTAHPHTHIVVRGKDENGTDLILARDYLTSGIRERAVELVELDLGPRSAREIETSLRAEISQERLTSIDRLLIADADSERTVATYARDPGEQSARAGRLAVLERMGLAEPCGGGRYRLVEDIERTLRTMGERGDIVRTMQREFTRLRIERSTVDQIIYDPTANSARPLIGRIVASGLADEHADHRYMILDGADGRTHYVSLGCSGDAEDVGSARGEGSRRSLTGSIVRIAPLQSDVREVDRTIAAVAAASNGHYDVDFHLRHDPRASQAFAKTHVRRLEAMRRESNLVSREPDGRWTIAGNHLNRVAAWQQQRRRDRPLSLEILTHEPLTKLATLDAATWIDRDLVSGGELQLRDAGFGRDLADARNRRRMWLVEQGLASETGGRIVFADGFVDLLRRRELLRVAGEIERETQLPYRETRVGEKVEGTYRRALDLVSGKHAFIERSQDFTLVPWKPVLEKHVHKTVSGMVRTDGVGWSVGRSRSGQGIT